MNGKVLYDVFLKVTYSMDKWDITRVVMLLKVMQMFDKSTRLFDVPLMVR